MASITSFRNETMSSEKPVKRPIPTVGGLVFNQEGQILLIRTEKWSDLLGTPGGKMEYGETMEESFIREFKEETNLDVFDVEFILIQDGYNLPEFYKPSHFLLMNFIAKTNDTEVTLNDEAYEYHWVDLEKSLEMDLNQPTRLLIERVIEMRK